MSHYNQENMPADDQYWAIAADAIELQSQDQALLHEQYMQRVADFRSRFFAKMTGLNAIEHGRGWAMFDDDNTGSTAELGARDVLLYCGAYKRQAMAGYLIPLIRIATNEPYVDKDKNAYICEDITIKADGYAYYSLECITFENDNTEQQLQALATSVAPFFYIADGALRSTPNMKPVTTPAPVSCDLDPTLVVKPFGADKSITDSHYALDRAEDILDSLANMKPVKQHEL